MERLSKELSGSILIRDGWSCSQFDLGAVSSWLRCRCQLRELRPVERCALTKS